jgi:hypothetical protein
MATERVIVELRAYLSTISNASVMHFDSGFEAVHMTWHKFRRYKDKPIGFVSLHHEVVNSRNALLRKNGVALPPPWRGKNNPPGVPAGPNPRYPGTWIKQNFRDTNPSPLNSITNPQKFSNYLETWHNEVHSRPEYPTQFGNPQVNVHMYMFWCWHALIEELFLNWMRSQKLTYDSLNHAIL